MSIALLDDSTLSTCPVVTSAVNYLGDMDVLPVFHAQHRERDNLVLESHDVEIHYARALPDAPARASVEIRAFAFY